MAEAQENPPKGKKACVHVHAHTHTHTHTHTHKLSFVKRYVWLLLIVGRWSRFTFSYSFQLSISKTLDIMYETNKRRLKIRRKKAHWLGNLGPKEWHGGEFPGFSYCLIYHRHGTERNLQLENAYRWKQKGPHKSLLSLAKWPRKGQPNKIENILGNTCSTPAKHYRWNGGPMPIHASKGHPSLLLPGVCNQAAQHPHREAEVREGKIRSWDFYHCQLVTRSHLHPPQCQCRLHGEPELPPALAVMRHFAPSLLVVVSEEAYWRVRAFTTSQQS